ncbi:MAG: hypothetical protein K6L80_00665 [Agarilytica sp.]
MKRPRFLSGFSFTAIKTLLSKHYSAPLTESFHRFRNGLIYFTVGFMIVFYAQTTIEDSLKLELITLFGLLMIAIGFFIAMMAQIRMIISRLVSFFKK